MEQSLAAPPAYRREHGTGRVSHAHRTGAGFALGHRLVTQPLARSDDTISAQRIAALGMG